MIYIVSVSVFSGIILSLVGLLLAVEAAIVKKGNRRIVINNDPDHALDVPGGSTLLSALVGNGVFLPSACGGGGSCGMCRCRVDEGGGSVLPTELAHLSRTEKRGNVRLACQLKVKQDLKISIPEEIFSVKKYHATVVSNENVATFIKYLEMEIDDDPGLDLEAGGYIQIDIPEYEMSYNELRARVADKYKAAWDRFNLWGLQSKLAEPIFRAYSLANPPYEPRRLAFTIRIATPPPGQMQAPPGKGSSYIFNLKPGDSVTLSGPYGEFHVKDSSREMCFIGGGAGMAPLRSQILDQLHARKTSRTISFWYGARSLQEMFFADEFNALADRHSNFTFHIALSEPQPEDHWRGMVGFIHQCLYDNYLKNHADPTEIEFYLCGPPPMIDAVIQLLDDLGVEPDMIAYDKF